MTAAAVPKRPLPVYDPSTDGNVFEWILKVSPQLRQHQGAETHQRWVERETERRAKQVKQHG